ncbi:conserved hypothetical protein [Hyphomonas neptunium ATCC 15444]|uniref:DUF695 domain-containing protein n=2 Tax=Hyphomonas TaxID=85 RepID=Q0C3G1_HYPNA|nr:MULTISPECIES: DUF695 domain-containing protein [Hyphomonas]ABI76357.1 conserved hypothetical protein [Hyphomonas neptunium ATCC 15444]KCZ96059.1 hypothetical protein HHI_00230 [Hyphomonas hirschiana VP5]
MSEDVWRAYFADMGGQPAAIVFNDGIAGRVNDLALVHAMKIRVPLKAPRADGLNTKEEAGLLGRLDEQLAGIITGCGGEYLGRVTNNGARWLLALIPPYPQELEAALHAAAAAEGYAPEIHVEQDPAKAIYWQDLYPSEDDRQVMVDMEVQAVLRERGDLPEKSRQIGHWIYFRDEAPAQRFAGWAEENKYQNIAVTPPAEDGPPLWRVRMSHQGTLRLEDISGHSLAIGRQAREAGGQYDGWESPVTL